MPWTQIYDPTGSPVFSTILAATPLIVLLGTLGLLGWSAPRAAASGLVTALVVVIGVYGMPWQSAIAAATYGAGFGLFPIGWIVFSAVFLYLLTVESGQFEIVKSSVVALSPDHRIQALLIRSVCRRCRWVRDTRCNFGSPVDGCRFSTARSRWPDADR